jgi:hypothetical protein
MRPSIYDLVANTFNVLEIADPLRLTVSPGEKLQNVWERFMELDAGDDWFCLVRDDEHIYGYLARDDEVFDAPLVGTAGENATPIPTNALVPGSMSLLELPPLFQRHWFYFVLTRNEITHVVAFPDLDKLPVKLCLFSLVMELESAMLELLVADKPAVERYLAYLPQRRRLKAEELCKMKYREVTSVGTVLCTTFVDKKQMLRRNINVLATLPFDSRAQYDSFFKRIEDVRNQIAHSDSIIRTLNTPEVFDRFVATLRELTGSIRTLQKLG